MGVKSLWTLVTPVGRPVMLETVEGKAMAIDSSIWLYQFQATMRDKDGRALANAHVLGFLRRIAKLLFYGLKPVFVFDGGAPALKRNTLNERRKKKSGAATTHVKLAEKLLAAQMRREALNHAQKASQKSKATGSGPPPVIPLNDDTVYLEDIVGPGPKTPPVNSTKANKFRDHDPYRLPEVDLEEAVTKATRSAAPDPRLATEDELRAFIEEMRPEDFDINSPAFHELPTEVQYEIIGDLRLKSRQTSYARLHKMLKKAATPLDFSKEQIKNLRQRNALTQQLLTTTDSIGSAHIAIPVRIASERNKEYILMKNEGEFGGWILGIKDTGTREKPILIDHEEPTPAEDDSDADMEEVEVPAAIAPDQDLREYQREMALAGLGRRNISKGSRLVGVAKSINRKTKTRGNLRFDLHEDEEPFQTPRLDEPDEEDDLLAYAVQVSMESAVRSPSASPGKPPPNPPYASTSQKESTPEDDFYADDPGPSRLDWALAFANSGSSRSHSTPSKTPISSLFGKPSLLTSPTEALGSPPKAADISDSDDDMEEVNLELPISKESTLQPGLGSPPLNVNEDELEQSAPKSGSSFADPTPKLSFVPSGMLLRSPENPRAIAEPRQVFIDSDEEMEEVLVNSLPTEYISSAQIHTQAASSSKSPPRPRLDLGNLEPAHSTLMSSTTTPPVGNQDEGENENEERLFAWSRTPSPSLEIDGDHPSPPAEAWDAADEIDVHAEEGEFARFMSQMKGKNLEEVRSEIDDEIKGLNHQRKAAIRDSEDITQQMIAQIMTMLRLFGIPYITAPMEAEAQCAELVTLGLVDGVITDDSDVFLFGAQRVYKNMFNQSKTVECFLLSDLSRELGMDRDTLIQLAYLLGSDYTEGLPGVGPVVAMELLKEFPGHGGLHKFKDWWTKVQSGKDKEEDNKSKFRKQFKKKFKNLYLASDWPNSVVRDAYYHPTVDSSEEPFKWGMPDLDGLRAFLREELGWRQHKVDELLLPIIQRMNKRSQAAALNKQGNLNTYLDITAGSGTHAPRQRQAYASKRLQQVISDFRKAQKSGSLTPSSRSGSVAVQDEDEGNNNGSGSEEEERPKKRKRKQSTPIASGSKTKKGPRPPAKVSRGRGRAKRKGKARVANSASPDNGDSGMSGEDDAFVPSGVDAVADRDVLHEFTLRPRPKPKPKQKSHADPGPSTAPSEETFDDPERMPSMGPQIDSNVDPPS
ncbi:hypothetical protein M413DRAFT_19658 [Hebeloma cylindrosporum]|uniref:PIN domain-like protein n=1 Tax=Hebeloma cylindrosporum TaxID=76867 RepID=A0A0C2XQQ1_HEBCY|nr:hypothetical protein M413DRAFT_19658 [Hebeloma cylindrosporum h7]